MAWLLGHRQTKGAATRPRLPPPRHISTLPGTVRSLRGDEGELLSAYRPFIPGASTGAIGQMRTFRVAS